jgi:Domain of unknown function (DUF4184)
VPFTLSHAAAALPLGRFRFVPSALVIGTLAPDFEYFIMLVPMDRYGHTLIGLFLLTLPMALVVLWIFHNLVKRPAVMLLPDAVQRRLVDHIGNFQFGGVGRFLLIVFSILVGAATHLLWDSFTHRTGWFFHHWALMRQPVSVPVLGSLPYYKVFQHTSTVLGLVILLVWFVLWYRRSAPSSQPIAAAPPARTRVAILTAFAIVGSIGALIRATIGSRTPSGRINFREFVIDGVVTLVALAWWELVAYGIFIEWTQRANSSSSTPLEEEEKVS